MVATLLAAQTMKGSASVVLETGDHPALLKDAVTTPAGCTIDGILELEEGKLRVYAHQSRGEGHQPRRRTLVLRNRFVMSEDPKDSPKLLKSERVVRDMTKESASGDGAGPLPLLERSSSPASWVIWRTNGCTPGHG